MDFESSVQKTLAQINDNLAKSLGSNYGDHVNDDATHEGNWFAFQVIADAVIGGIVEEGVDVAEMVGVTLISGFIYYASDITEITLTSGHIKLFRVRKELNY